MNSSHYECFRPHSDTRETPVPPDSNEVLEFLWKAMGYSELPGLKEFMAGLEFRL